MTCTGMLNGSGARLYRVTDARSRLWARAKFWPNTGLTWGGARRLHGEP